MRIVEKFPAHVMRYHHAFQMPHQQNAVKAVKMQSTFAVSRQRGRCLCPKGRQKKSNDCYCIV